MITKLKKVCYNRLIKSDYFNLNGGESLGFRRHFALPQKLRTKLSIEALKSGHKDYITYLTNKFGDMSDAEYKTWVENVRY